jgi:hypothetical protein
VSVDTYLKRKNLTRYQRVQHGGVEILVAPILASQASRISLDVRRGWFTRSFELQVEPLGDHFHSPACSH